nr:hypothetical protein CFP56_20853 [Quercus suber]
MGDVSWENKPPQSGRPIQIEYRLCHRCCGWDRFLCLSSCGCSGTMAACAGLISAMGRQKVMRYAGVLQRHHMGVPVRLEHQPQHGPLRVQSKSAVRHEQGDLSAVDGDATGGPLHCDSSIARDSGRQVA